MNPDSIASKIIRLAFYALFFTVPLIFIPGHIELFQFNKMMLVYLLTAIITSAWLIRMLLQKRLFIRRTPFDIPILLFLTSQIISTILSIEPHTSIWGYYSRFHGGLLSTISYILLYYAFVSNTYPQNLVLIKKDRAFLFQSIFARNCLISLLTSATVVSLYGILEHFGIDEHYWIQDVRNRVFSTLGQPNWLAAFLITITPLSLVGITKPGFSKRPSFNRNTNALFITHFFLLIIFYLTLLYTKSRSGLLGFAVMYATFWSFIVFKLANKNKFKIRSLINHPLIGNIKKTTATLIAITLLIGTPFTPNFSQIANKLVRKPQPQSTAQINKQPPLRQIGGTESGDIRKIVWKGAINVWKHWPIFGSGVETFAYSYYNFRPIEHNFVSEWDFLYNKAHNEYLNFLATTGVVGLGTLLLLISYYTIWSIKQIVHDKLVNGQWLMVNGLLSGYLGLAVALFFGFSTVTTGLLFFIYPAFALLCADQKPAWLTIGSKKQTKTPNWVQITLVSLIIVLLAVSVTKLSKRWYADRIFAKAKRLSSADEIGEALILEQKASALVPDEPLFHDKLALDLARSASALFREGELETALLFEKTAKANSDLAILQNPVHLNYVKNRAAIMLHLSTIDPKYKQMALDTLLYAEKLSPTDPKIPYNIGLYYLQENQTQKAIETFQKAIKLKPDYVTVRLSLASAFKKQGNSEKARQQYQYILENIDPQNSQAIDAIKN